MHVQETGGDGLLGLLLHREHGTGWTDTHTNHATEEAMKTENVVFDWGFVGRIEACWVVG